MFRTPRDLYHSKEWQQLRDQLMIERVNEDGQLICCRCGKPILKRYDCIGHHKIELTEENVNDFEISLNPEHIELIHLICHNDIHERFSGFKQKVYIVHGAPCSGKSTYVREHAKKDDLIFDMDAIYSAISLASVHEQPKRLKPVAFAIRDAIMDQIRIRSGTWRTAWIISSKTQLELERDADLLGANLIHVDTNIEDCLANLERDPSGRNPEEWKRYIEDYFERQKHFSNQEA